MSIGTQPGSAPAVPRPAVSTGRPSIAWLLASLVIAGAILRIIRIDHQSLWIDEVLTWLSSSGTIWYVLTQTDVNTNIPPLYYLLTNVSLRLGDGELWLRLPALLAGILTIPMMYLVTRHWFGERLAGLTAALVAFAPFHIWYSQEARPYSLLLLLSLVAIWFAQRLVSTFDSRRDQAGFVLSVAAILWCHTIGAAFVGFLLLLVVLSVPRPAWGKWALLVAASALLAVPAAIRLLTFPPTSPSAGGYSFSPVHVAYAFWTFFAGYSLGPSIGELHLPERVARVRGALPIILPALTLVGLLVVVGVRALWFSDRRRLLLVVLWFFVPLGFAVSAAVATSHTFNVRYAILSFAPFALLVAAGLEGLGRRNMRVAAVALLGAVAGASLLNHYANPRYAREDTRSAAAHLAERARAGDLVVASAGYMAITLRHYLPAPAVEVVGFDPEDGAARVTERIVHRGSLAHLDSLIADRNVIWLFSSRSYHGDPGGLIPAHLADAFAPAGEFTAPGVRLTRFERRMR